ncbi:YybH family protein [Sinomicrobium sp.]
MMLNNTFPGSKLYMNMFFAFVILFSVSCNNDVKEDTFIPFKKGLQHHLNALKNKDITQFEPTVGDSVVCILPNGDTLITKSKFMDFHKKWFSDKNWEFNYTILKTNSVGDFGYAWLQYQYVEKDDAGQVLETDNNYLTLLFQKSKNGWQLVHDQNTIILDKK